MMRRFMVLVMVVLLMTAMLVASVTRVGGGSSATGRTNMGDGGTPVDPIVCTVVAEDSLLIGWRNGTCWVFHPAL